MVYGESNGHVTDDVTWVTPKSYVVTPIHLQFKIAICQQSPITR